MKDIRNIRLRRLHGQLGEIVYELTRAQFAQCAPTEGWLPAINAYRCDDRIIICVDLAGVEREKISLQVEARRVLLRGQRRPPEPEHRPAQFIRILAMEIDSGPFEREVPLPWEVEPEQVTAEQRNGMLWIYLPLRSNG